MGHKLPARTRARSRAVDVLYEAHVKELDDPAGIYSLARLRETETTAQTPLPAYAREILEGVADHLERIDAALATYSRAWSLHRMPEVDLAIMRVATWEILFNPDVEGPTAITAAMQIASERSTDESPKFINGLLGTINDVKDALVAGKTPEVLASLGAQDQPVSFDQAAKEAKTVAENLGGVLENPAATEPEEEEETAGQEDDKLAARPSVISQIDLESLE